jgi:flagellar hook-associated protein 3 FlgL
MRITSEVMVTRSIERLHNRLAAYERSQSELGTGKRILRPSDDPAGARRAMGLQSAMRAREQDLNNISDGLGWLNTTDTQLQVASDRMSRARELAVRGATSSGPNERTAIATELRQIAEEMASIANHRHLGRPLFGGFTAGDAVEFDGTVWTSNGDGDEVRRRVSDSETVRVNITAHEWMGFEDGEDLLTLLANLADDVETGPGGLVSAHLDAMDRALGRIGDGLATIGAATNRIDSARSRAESLSLTLRTELSEVQDVDMAQGLMELQIQEVGYEATLSALAKALPPSLVAFLR